MLLHALATVRRWRVLVTAITLTVVFSLASWSVALAESFSTGQYSGGSTWYYEPIGNGHYYFTAYGSSGTSFADASVFATIYGYNDGGGWHRTGSAGCYRAPYGSQTCTTATIRYDSTECSDCYNNYATTQHYFERPSGSATYYTSNDGAHSTYRCFYFAGC